MYKYVPFLHKDRMYPCSIESRFHFSHCTQWRPAPNPAVSFQCKSYLRLSRQAWLLLSANQSPEFSSHWRRWGKCDYNQNLSVATPRLYELTCLLRRLFQNVGHFSEVYNKFLKFSSVKMISLRAQRSTVWSTNGQQN